MKTISLDPARKFPGISVWENGELQLTFKPCFSGGSGEKRLAKVAEWQAKYPEFFNPFKVQEAIVESNSLAGGKEIGCFFAGIWAAMGIKVYFVSPIHVARWAEKKFNVKLCNIPRNLKKKRTKELVELFTNRENLSFDECDSILNYYYWKDVRSDPRHHNQPTV